MSDAAIPAGVNIYAFALMETSVLLFLKSGSTPLSKFVHRMQAGYFNRIRVLHGRSQALVHDRHREILVEEGPLFPHVVRRVILAPVIGEHWSNESEARKWGEISTNRWTSFPVVLGRLENPPGFDQDSILQFFSRFDSEKPADAFSKFIIMGIKKPVQDILDHVVAMSLLGSSEFVQKYYEGAKGRKKIKSGTKRSQSESTRLFERKFKKIVKIVAKEFKSSPDELTKARSRHPGRKFLVELAMRHVLDERGVTYLGTRLNVSGSALAHLRRSFNKQLETNPDIFSTFTRLEKVLLGD